MGGGGWLDASGRQGPREGRARRRDSTQMKRKKKAKSVENEEQKRTVNKSLSAVESDLEWKRMRRRKNV